jgi:hypothetical protein
VRSTGDLKVRFFQAWGSRYPAKYRELLLNIATEEISHVEMPATGVAVKVEKVPVAFQEMAADPLRMARSAAPSPRCGPLRIILGLNPCSGRLQPAGSAVTRLIGPPS